MQQDIINPRLNQQQLDMIRLFKKPMPDEYFLQIRRLAVQLLGMQLDNVVDNWESENNVTAETYNKLSKGHLRTSYKKSE